MISRRNESFSVVDDPLIREMLIKQFGGDYIMNRTYYSTTGLENVWKLWQSKVKAIVGDREYSCTADIWSLLGSEIALFVVTGTIINDLWERIQVILNAKAITRPHNNVKIGECFDEALENLELSKEKMVYITRDDGSDIKLACNNYEVESNQCAPHCYNRVVADAFKSKKDTDGNETNEALILKNKSQKLAASFCRNPARRKLLNDFQKAQNISQMRIPRIMNVRFNSIYFCCKGIVINEGPLLAMALQREDIYLDQLDFEALKEIVEVLQYFHEETLKVN